MIELRKYIRPDLILTDMDCADRNDAISKLVRQLFASDTKSNLPGIGYDDVYNAVMERENLSTTGIGNSLAFPHARIEQCEDLVVVIGLCKNPVDFKSLDGKPCDMIFMMLSPAKNPYIILQVMAAITRVLAEKSNAEAIRDMESPEQIADFIISAAFTDGKTIFARDIMRPVQQYARLEDPIEKIAHIMHLNHYDVLPVIDEKDVLCGQISCLDLFSYSTPDFFNQLQTVSFVRYMDPFEKYFKLKKDLKVKDLYQRKTNAILKDATLMEIVFQMTAKNHAELFIVDGGKLVGLIDRFSVIDRILFF